MPAKNRPFDNNDLGDMFAEADIEAGDQGAPPGMDEFAEGDLDAGDQNMNMGGDDDIIFNDEEDELDQEADELDKEFLKEISKPAAAKKADAGKATKTS